MSSDFPPSSVKTTFELLKAQRAATRRAVEDTDRCQHGGRSPAHDL